MPDVFLRKAERKDLNAIEIFFDSGRAFLRDQGLPQWQNGHGPTREAAAGDIERGEGFVLTDGSAVVCGYSALIRGTDEYYTAIRRLDKTAAAFRGSAGGACVTDAPGTWDGTWPEYVSVHRVALSADARGKGLARVLMAELISEAKREGFRDIRVDTHAGNKIMRRVIEGAGFTLRGEIEFPFPNGERLAYQLLVSL